MWEVSELPSLSRLKNSPRTDGPHQVTHFPADGHLGHSHLLGIANTAATNTGDQRSLPALAGKSSGYISRSGLAGSCGNSTFSFLRDHQTIFIVATPFYTPPTTHRACIPPHCCPIDFVFFHAAIAGGCGPLLQEAFPRLLNW